MAVNAKARVVQSIACPSITAAAEFPVTFGRCFYRLEARLFKRVELKCGSGERRILRRLSSFVGAAHWAARGFQASHMFSPSCRGDPCGRPSVYEAVRPVGRALQRSRNLQRRNGQAPPLQNNRNTPSFAQGRPLGLPTGVAHNKESPSSAPFGGTCPYPLCPFGTSPLDKGSRPP